MTPLFLHHHIFKNAGTTIDGILKRELGTQWVEVEPEGGLSRVGAQTVESLLHSNPELRGISSHHLAFERYVHPEKWLIEIVVVRHPLDRFASIYRHYRRVADGSVFSLVAGSESLAGFCNEIARRFPCMMFDSQCAILGNEGSWFFPPNDDMFRRACSVLRSAPVVLTVESLSRGLVTAEHFLRQIIPNLSLAYVPLNVTKRANNAHECVLAEVRCEMGDSLWDFLLERNQFDIQLWEIARSEVERRVQRVLGFEELLRDFDSRCAALAGRGA